MGGGEGSMGGGEGSIGGEASVVSRVADLGLEEEEEEEENDELDCLDALFYDEAKLVAEAVREEERLRREAEEEAKRKAEIRRRGLAHKAVLNSILEYDPKIKREVYTRFFLEDFSIFDINEESPVRPMRYTHSMYENEFALENSANILAVKIVSSDVDFPISVYGTVIARDSIDYKCIHVFHRHRDDSQLINSKGQLLILTGPGRGLVLLDFIYLEVDLKIKADQEHMDRRFSKGLLSIDGRVLSRDEVVEVGRTTLDSWLSTVEVIYATVQGAIEATVEFKVLEGNFYGKISTGTTGIPQRVLLHDSKADGVMACDGSGIIKLRRRVMVVCVDKMLIFTILNKAGDAADVRTFEFTPSRTGADEQQIVCGAAKFEVKVTWSLMHFEPETREM